VLCCPACKQPISPDHPQGTDSERLAGPGDGPAEVFHKACADTPVIFYKVVHNGSDSCTWPTREEAEQDIEDNGEQFFENEASDWRIEEVLMTWRQFKALPEHTGW
jgi:hypothetical protein